jgi:hypothetical protein
VTRAFLSAAAAATLIGAPARDAGAAICSASVCTPTTACSTACSLLDDPGPPPIYLPSTCGEAGYACGAPTCTTWDSDPREAIDCKIGLLEWSGCSPAVGAAPASLSVHASNDGQYKDCAQGRVVYHGHVARAMFKASGGATTGIWGRWTTTAAVRSAVGYPIADTQSGNTKQQFENGHLLLSGTTASGTAYIAGGLSMPPTERAALLALLPTAPAISPSDTTATSSGGGGWGFGAIGSSSKPIWVVKAGGDVAFKVGGAGGANAIVDRWNAESNVSGPLGWPVSSTLPLTGDGSLPNGSAGIACGSWSSGPGFYTMFAGGNVYWKTGAATAYTVPPGVIQLYWSYGTLRGGLPSCAEAGPLGWPASNQTNARNAIYPKAQLFQRGSERTYLVATSPSTVFEMMPAVYDYWTSVTGGANGWLGMPVGNWAANAEGGQPFERGTVFFSTDQNTVFGVEGAPRSACLAKYVSLGGAISSGLGHPLGNNGFEGTDQYGTMRKQLFENGFLITLGPTLCLGSYAPLAPVGALRARRGVFDRDHPSASEVIHVRPNEPAPWAAPYGYSVTSREHRYFPTVKLEFMPVSAPLTTIERSTKGTGAGANWAPIRLIADSEGVLQAGVTFTFTDSWQTAVFGGDNALAFPGENCYRVTVQGTSQAGQSVSFTSAPSCVATRAPVTNNSPQFSGSMTVQPLSRMQIRLWGHPEPSVLTGHERYSQLRVELQHRAEGFGDDDTVSYSPVGNATVFSPWHVEDAGAAGLAFDLKLEGRADEDDIKDFRDVTRLKITHPEANRAGDYCAIPGGCTDAVSPFCVTRVQLVSNEIRAAGACAGGAATCRDAVAGYGAVRPGEVFFERDYGGGCAWVGKTDGPSDTSSSEIEISYQELHGDWQRRHPAPAGEPANTQPTQGGRVRRWFAPYGAAGMHAEMLREQIESMFADGLFQAGVSGANYGASHHALGRHLSGANPVTQYWVDPQTTIFKVDITAEGEGGCWGDAHAHVYLTLHTDGTTGTAANPGRITVEADASASGSICGDVLATLVYALSGGYIDFIGEKVEEITRQVNALAEDRQAPASPVPLNLLFCCNGNIEVNCCSGDNTHCEDRPAVNYTPVYGAGYSMDPHLPPPSSERPLLCSDLTP